jgi:hypothetical protein
VLPKLGNFSFQHYYPTTMMTKRHNCHQPHIPHLKSGK